MQFHDECSNQTIVSLQSTERCRRHIICDTNGTVIQLDTHIYVNDYKSTFENSWINLTFFPPNLQTLSFYKCGFQGNVDFKRFPLSIQSIDLSYNNFDLIFDTHNDTKMVSGYDDSYPV